MAKPIICVDFDGVIHSYEHGWQGGEIYGSATPGFFDWAVKAIESFSLVVYSSRSKTPEGIKAMQRAINLWALDWVKSENQSVRSAEKIVQSLEFSDVKPPAFLTIDDRAICFQGNWGLLDPAELLQFQTWTQRTQRDRSDEFVNDYNKAIATIAHFSAKYMLPAPDLIFHPSWLDIMNASLPREQRILGTLIFMGVRVRFGCFEQRDVLRQYP